MNILILILGLAFAATERQVTVTTLKVKETGGTNEISLKAPASFSTNYSFTLPSTVGTTGQALVTNGTGALSYADVPTLTGFGTLSNKVLLSPLISGGTLDAALATNINISSGTASLNKIRTTHVEFTSQGSAPFTPGSGTLSLYVKSDNKAYLTTDTGLDISLGSSGGEATNLLSNASFDSGSIGHSLPAGTMAVSLTDLIDGTQALFFSASSTAGTIASQILEPTGSFGGVNLESALFVKTTVGSLEVCSMQGFSAVQCTDVPTSGAWTNVIANMAGPSSGSFGYALRTKNNVAVSGTIGIDAAYTGRARNLAEVSQAQIWASRELAQDASCFWLKAANNWNATGSVTCGAATESGRSIAPAAPNQPAIRTQNLPPGKYQVTFFTTLRTDYVTTSTSCLYRITDGTNNKGSVLIGPATSTSTSLSGNIITAEFEYTTVQTDITWSLRMNRVAGGGNCYILNNDYSDQIFSAQVKRYPTQNEIVARADTNNWYVDAQLAGDEASLGVADVTSYTEITDADLTLTPSSSSSAVGVMCSSTNPATAPSTSATTCAAGSESVGINFVIPKTGFYEVCFSAQHLIIADGTSNAGAAFRIEETATNAQTALQSGSDIRSTFLAPSNTTNTQIPFNTCSVLNFSSLGTKGVRLKYVQDVTGTPGASSVVMSGSGFGRGAAVGRWSVRPALNYNSTPLYVGSVTSNSSGLKRIESAMIAGNSTPSAVCSTGNCTILRDDGSNWLSQVAFNSTGTYEITIASGIFSGPPKCNVGTGYPGVIAYGFGSAACTSATVCSMQTFNAAGAATNHIATLRCEGPR